MGISVGKRDDSAGAESAVGGAVHAVAADLYRKPVGADVVIGACQQNALDAGYLLDDRAYSTCIGFFQAQDYTAPVAEGGVYRTVGQIPDHGGAAVPAGPGRSACDDLPVLLADHRGSLLIPVCYIGYDLTSGTEFLIERIALGMSLAQTERQQHGRGKFLHVSTDGNGGQIWAKNSGEAACIL